MDNKLLLSSQAVDVVCVCIVRQKKCKRQEVGHPASYKAPEVGRIWLELQLPMSNHHKGREIVLWDHVNASVYMFP